MPINSFEHPSLSSFLGGLYGNRCPLCLLNIHTLFPAAGFAFEHKPAICCKKEDVFFVLSFISLLVSLLTKIMLSKEAKCTGY